MLALTAPSCQACARYRWAKPSSPLLWALEAAQKRATVNLAVAAAVVLLKHILPHRAVEVAVALTFFAGAGSALCDGLRGGDDQEQADRLELGSVPYALGA
jgi:hypothetical protein